MWYLKCACTQKRPLGLIPENIWDEKYLELLVTILLVSKEGNKGLREHLKQREQIENK